MCKLAVPLRHWLGFVTLLLAGCATPVPPSGQPPVPQPVDTQARPVVAVSAHPLATRAALQVLAEGGSAIDATVAAQMVLGLVEPQSSGIGGGLLMLVWDAPARRLRSYDGLAAAPARTTASLRTDVDGRQLPADAVARGGRSVGVPGGTGAGAPPARQPALGAAVRPRHPPGGAGLPDGALPA